MPEAIVGWKETINHDDEVVLSPVPVMVDESMSPWLLVWMILTGVVAGVGRLSLVWVGCGVDMLVVIVHPLKRREFSAAVREAAWLLWWDCSASWMALRSCLVYSHV